MKVSFDYLDEFERGAKVLRKRYPSFESDYDAFLNELEKNPFGGESLGHHTYKNRMSIAYPMNKSEKLIKRFRTLQWCVLPLCDKFQ